MKSQLAIAIQGLCISYHQMRLTESDLDRYDDSLENNKETISVS